MVLVSKWSEKGAPGVELLAVRKAVFMEEQKFTYDEDGMDALSYHLAVCDEKGRVLGAARIYKEQDAYHAGRICVLKDFRGLGLGAYIMKQIEDKAASLGGKKVVLGAQMQASGFYKKMGYTPVGHPYFEESCEHINMMKLL